MNKKKWLSELIQESINRHLELIDETDTRPLTKLYACAMLGHYPNHTMTNFYVEWWNTLSDTALADLFTMMTYDTYDAECSGGYPWAWFNNQRIGLERFMTQHRLELGARATEAFKNYCFSINFEIGTFNKRDKQEYITATNILENLNNEDGQQGGPKNDQQQN